MAKNVDKVGKSLTSNKYSKTEELWFYLFISPWGLGFVALVFGPIVFSIVMSFTDWDLIQGSVKFVGLNNYIKLLTKDHIFWKSVFNTFYYSFISIPIFMALSLLIAYFLNKKLTGMSAFRVLYYLPNTVPVVATTLLFIWFFAPDAGLINRFLSIFGIDGPAWLLDAQWVKLALVIMSLWGVGGSIVLILAGMQGIPAELYESASIDGASHRRQFFMITFPMISSVLFFNLIMGIIGSLQTFAQVYIMTTGGPNNASMMIVPYLFDNAFHYYRMGYASAIAWVLFIIILIFSLIVFRSSAIWVYYEEGKGKNE